MRSQLCILDMLCPYYRATDIEGGGFVYMNLELLFSKKHLKSVRRKFSSESLQGSQHRNLGMAPAGASLPMVSFRLLVAYLSICSPLKV